MISASVLAGLVVNVMLSVLVALSYKSSIGAIDK
jgi:hypothetical protein